MFANGSDPAFATRGTGYGERAVGDRWVRFAYDATGPSGTPPYSVAGFFGYDVGKKQFVQTIVDISGTYQPSFSTGWRGDTLSFEARMDGPIVVRDVFVRKASQRIHTFHPASGTRREMGEAGRGGVPADDLAEGRRVAGQCTTRAGEPRWMA